MILEQDENSKKVTGYQLAYIIFETMRILTKYCIIREIHINILRNLNETVRQKIVAVNRKS